jgi:glycosyltransferase involved in cell wall biosynthesis
MMIATGSDRKAAGLRVGCTDDRSALELRGGWLHLCNGLDPVRDGGMVPSILGMTAALGRLKGGLAIVTPTPSRIDPANLGEEVTLSGPETDLEEVVRRAAVVHRHGRGQNHTRRVAPAARAARVPYLIAAHGMAEPWALKHKRLKKQIYLALVEAKNLRRAACLHALSRPEIGHLRAIAPRTPVCFVPNGVDLAPFDQLPERSTLEDEHPELKGKLVLLFFGRVHVKKGLDLLADALSQVAPEHPELHLLVAGKDDGAWGPFRARMTELGLRDRLTYLGHVAGERARQVWATADAFVLPSYSEGFSMAILEALACRLPCLITAACHFPELGGCGGGIIVKPDAGGVTSGLRELLERSSAERAQLGGNGRQLVETEYTWDRQGARLAAVYEWVLGGGPPPEAVERPNDGAFQASIQ